ncbi:hypothetical protein AUR64_16965 [Haloprofundus marisrubri]|uniref:Uncharacterized protein n=1 Tax=Haloprofundus marisrubri TaxID=1514971 RepID=A0A0W1R7R4_9EURY|nr:hypothetical protein [Haloprofundus marisrubri]KTG09466.1 hypothetical protein AUR64_16965 [Haloprofundus marisrubri]
MSGTFVRKPALLSSTLALLVAAAATVHVTDVTVAAVALVAGGVLVTGVGATLQSRRETVLRWVVVAAGVGVSLVGVAIGASEASGPGALVRTLPSLLGVLVVGLALAPVRNSGSRGLLKAGAALLFLTVLVSGLLDPETLEPLLVGTVATVLVYDLGEQAINVGEQLGRSAETKSLEATHAAGSVGVGVLTVFLGGEIATLGSGGLSLSALVLVVVAVLLLAAALHE